MNPRLGMGFRVGAGESKMWTLQWPRFCNSGQAAVPLSLDGLNLYQLSELTLVRLGRMGSGKLSVLINRSFFFLQG